MREEIVEPISLRLSDHIESYYYDTTVTRHADTVTFNWIAPRLEYSSDITVENTYDDTLRSTHDVDHWRYYDMTREEWYALDRYEVSPNIYLLTALQCYIRDDIGFWLGRYHARVIRNASFLWYIIVLQRRWKEDVVIKIDDYQLNFYGNDKVLNLSELLNKKWVDVVDEICKKLEHEEAILIKLWLWN